MVRKQVRELPKMLNLTHLSGHTYCMELDVTHRQVSHHHQTQLETSIKDNKSSSSSLKPVCRIQWQLEI